MWIIWVRAAQDSGCSTDGIFDIHLSTIPGVYLEYLTGDIAQHRQRSGRLHFFNDSDLWSLAWIVWVKGKATLEQIKLPFTAEGTGCIFSRSVHHSLDFVEYDRRLTRHRTQCLNWTRDVANWTLKNRSRMVCSDDSSPCCSSLILAYCSQLSTRLCVDWWRLQNGFRCARVMRWVPWFTLICYWQVIVMLNCFVTFPIYPWTLITSSKRNNTLCRQPQITKNWF